ncbi:MULTISPECIES: cytochrome P450 [Nocardiopsidaceae]|uniref:Cytochrome P450 n=2 Tax=Nocardiopsidaceae TaxID=83676 RepID=A0ABY6YM87_9ACTN|nr:cytochrome P450 [Streptomonospora nanhaiensis]WAE73335.1 cytochrome P450 [Streptomonospora nanhaiensis]
MTTTRPGDETAPPGAPGSMPPRGCPADITRLYGTTPDTGRDALWAALRERHGPVAPVELETGVRAWLLLGYHENLTVLQNPHMFSRDTRRWREVAEGRVDLASARPALSWRPNVLYADGAEHTRLRGAVVEALARVDMAATSRMVRQLCEELIDAFVAEGRADLVAQYANPLPVLVINRLYGLSDSYGHMLGDLTALIFDEDAKRGEDAIGRVHQYFSGLVDRKREHPGPDLVSWILEHPSGLSGHEVAHQAALINNASHQPTTHLIGNTLRTLLTEDRIRGAYTDARLPVQELLDHVMWTDTPFQILPARFALQDMRIGNAEVRAGDALLIGFDAAHRDPAVRRGEDDGTGVASGSRAHLMFGAGAHACPAREMAKMIAATAVTILHERLTGMRLAVDPEELRWTPSPFLRGLRELPVVFVPGEPSAPDPAAGDESASRHRDGRRSSAGEEDGQEGDLLDRLLLWWRGLRG